MSWTHRGSRLIYDDDQPHGRRTVVAQVPDDLEITGVQELVRLRAFKPGQNTPALGRTFMFDPSTGMLWEEESIR